VNPTTKYEINLSQFRKGKNINLAYTPDEKVEIVICVFLVYLLLYALEKEH